MALNDWDEEDQRRRDSADEERAGELGGAGLIVFAGLAGFYVLIVAFLLDALKF